MNKFGKWVTHSAKWYQFWYPNSGLFGGLASGIILGLFLLVFFVSQIRI